MCKFFSADDTPTSTWKTQETKVKTFPSDFLLKILYDVVLDVVASKRNWSAWVSLSYLSKLYMKRVFADDNYKGCLLNGNPSWKDAKFRCWLFERIIHLFTSCLKTHKRKDKLRLSNLQMHLKMQDIPREQQPNQPNFSLKEDEDRERLCDVSLQK